ncbi:osmosensor protein [Plectosphaerella cucumerina]|uniref:Osmosensor protein n=1 Tax=Plectosphaerella cucumerina TaxID=40658 RepID=A0A8K0TWD9_9PEZI|nr:osmosensor protein [Plectosphaerella cucumerina]
MEHSRAHYGGRRGIQVGNVLGDPFALATLSIAGAAWFLTFIASIAAKVQGPVGPVSRENVFPSLAWWAIILNLLIIGGVFVIVASDTIQTYHVAATAYQAVSLAILSIVIHTTVFVPSAAWQAAAAGFILMAIVMCVWIVYFGAAPSAGPRAYVDSFALQKESAGARHTMNYGGGRPETSTSVQPPQMYTSAQLNGFENPSPGLSQVQQARNSAGPPTLNPAPTMAKPPGQDQEVVPPTEYPYRAKAIYSYEANPEDHNEISFSKHEILEVSDVSGRWWQARKENGDTGIAPSNYLILL